jgi:hypothetical protein
MYPHPNLDVRPQAERLLDDLATEERLLKLAREGVMSLYASLRKGDVVAVQAALPGHDELAERLHTQGEVRAASAARLAKHLGLSNENLALSALAAKLPEPEASRLLAFRTSLRDLTTQIEHFRAANANLIDRLRSYFQEVLSTITVQKATSRYGPSGEILSGPTIRATVATG